jgi:uncharacterized repeat protein (TIGR01451 family)
VTVDYMPEGCDNLTNNISVVGVPPNGDNVSDSDSMLSTICYADIEALKVDITPSAPAPNGWVWYEINITNNGLVDLENVRIVDNLPKGLQYDTAIPLPDNVSADNREILWANIGPMLIGDSVLIRLNVTVDPDAVGLLTNNVTVVGEPYNGVNVTGFDNATVGIKFPAITVIKTVDDSTITNGDQATFRLRIINTGELNLTEVRVVDVLPGGLLFHNASVAPNETSPLVWYNLTSLLVGEEFNLTIVVNSTSTGTKVNTVTVEAVPTNGPNMTDSDTATVTVSSSGGGGGTGGGGGGGAVGGFTFTSTGSGLQLLPAPDFEPEPPIELPPLDLNEVPGDGQTGGEVPEDIGPTGAVTGIEPGPTGAATTGFEAWLFWVGLILAAGFFIIFFLWRKKKKENDY